MKKDDTIQIVCPACSCEIVVDAATGQILHHESKDTGRDKIKKKSLQELMQEMEAQKERSAARFEEEKEALRHRKQILEKKFEEIKKHVDTSEDAPPPHPYDYD